MQSRLEQLMHRRVIYTVTDQDGIYTGTVERDSNGRAYVQDDNGICVLYDTGILATVEEEDMTDHKRYLDEKNKSTHLYIRMKLEKITLKFAQIFIFIFVTFFA